jgi:hypothetical protein
LDFFFPFSSLGAVVGGSSVIGRLPAMMFSASEGTTQIGAPSVARMGQKTDAAMDTVRYTLAQTRIAPQNRLKSVLILPDKRVNLVLEMPVFTKCEKLGDPDDKKARDFVSSQPIAAAF